jgi:putative tryptophan/tyrosine transport system substrate-binding protein
MKRREFVTMLVSAAALPLAARAQQADRVRHVGVLMAISDDSEGQARISALRGGLERLGWTEGHNLRIDTRWSGGDIERMRSHATELIASKPDLILANGSPIVTALLPETRTIPIVFAAVNDPLGQGFVASLGRPGGNITGFTLMEFAVLGKMSELLREMAPNIVRATAMFNPTTGLYVPGYLRSLVSSSPSLGIELTAAPVRDLTEIEATLVKLAREPGSGLIVPPDSFTIAHHKLIIVLAEQNRLPAIYAYRSFVGEGGLMSYGPDPDDIFRRAASYVDRILRGEMPSDLPVQQPTKFQFSINLKAANAIGIKVPAQLLALADEVIE